MEQSHGVAEPLSLEGLESIFNRANGKPGAPGLEILSADPERHIDQSDQGWHFNQRSNDTNKKPLPSSTQRPLQRPRLPSQSCSQQP